MKRKKKPASKATRDFPLSKAAALFGCTPRSMRLFIKKGMPYTMGKQPKRGGKAPMLVNLKEVEAWGMENDIQALREPVAVRKDSIAEMPSAPPAGAGEPPAKDIRFGVVAELERMRRVVFHMYQEFVIATKGQDDKRSRMTNRNYMDACKQLTDMEKVVDARKELERQVRDEVNEFVSSWIVPIRSYFDALPRTMASRFAPLEASKAEKILRDEIENKLLPMMAKKL